MREPGHVTGGQTGKSETGIWEGGKQNLLSSTSADGAPGSKREAKETWKELRERFDDGL